MKYFVISDNHDTLTGLRLAGIDGVQTNTPDELKAALDDVTGRSDIGILLIAEKCAAMQPGRIGKMKLELSAPLVVEIPDRFGTGREPDSITRYIRESIGIRI